MRPTALLLIACLAALAPAEAKKPAVAVRKLPATTQGAVQAKEVSLVRVNVTGQPFDYFRPWQKKAPFSKRARSAPSSRMIACS